MKRRNFVNRPGVSGTPFLGVLTLLFSLALSACNAKPIENIDERNGRATVEELDDLVDFKEPIPTPTPTPEPTPEPAVNITPIISSIANLTIDENTSTAALPFTIDDSDENLECATHVTASSDDSTLQPSGAIMIGGTGLSCTVTLTPATDQFGATTVTLTVSDSHGGTAYETFDLTVSDVAVVISDPFNDTPSIIGGEKILISPTLGLHSDDTVAYDWSGSGFDGTPMADTAVAHEAGMGGLPAYSMDGNDDYISLPSLGFSSSEYTVALWVKIDAANPAGRTKLSLVRGKGAYPFRGHAGFLANAHLLNLFFKWSDGTSSTKEYSISPVTDNSWHHLAFRKSDAGSWALFMDGTALTTTSDSGVVIRDEVMNFTNGGRIGTYSAAAAAGNYFLDGSIDDFRAFDRDLTSNEIKALAVSRGMKLPTGIGDETAWFSPSNADYRTVEAESHTDFGLLDLSGNGGTLTGSDMDLTVDVWKDGLKFDESQSQRAIPSSLNGNLPTGSMSICAWIKAGHERGNIMSNNGNNGARGFSFGIVSINGSNDRYSFSIATSSTSTVGIAGSTFGGAARVNEWHHVCGVFKAGEYFEIYEDGIRTADNATAETTQYHRYDISTPKISGTGQTGLDSASTYLDGNVDDIRMFDRALLSTEVAKLARSRSELPLGDEYGHWHPSLDQKGQATGTLYDLSGNEYHATIDGSGSSDWNISDDKRSVEFDATDSYFSNPEIASYDKNTPFSVSFWFRADAALTDFMQFIGKQESAAANLTGWQIGNGPDREKIRFMLASNDASDAIIVDSTANQLSAAGWYQVGVTYDGSEDAGGVKMYVNGSPVTMAITSNNLTGSTLNSEVFAIGTRPVDAAGSVDGLMDDIRLFNRRISDKEMAWLGSARGVEGAPSFSYHNLFGIQARPADPSLVARWMLQDHTSFGDETGNHDASIVGSPATTTGPKPWLPDAVSFGGSEYATTDLTWADFGAAGTTLFYLNPDREGGANFREYAFGIGSDSTASFSFQHYDVGRQLNVGYRDMSPSADFRMATPASSANYSSATWQSYSVHWDGSFDPIVYRDGVSLGAGSIHSGIPTSGDQFWIGGVSFKPDLLVGSLADLVYFNRKLGLHERNEWESGPEPYCTTSPTLAVRADGADVDLGVWQSGNGAITYTWQLIDWQHGVIVYEDSGTEIQFTISANFSGNYYLKVRASNDGGFDPAEDQTTSPVEVGGS